MAVTIRKFRKGDAVYVSDLVSRAQRIVLKDYYPKKLIEALCMKNTPPKIIRKSAVRQYFVAVDSDSKKVVGIAGLEGDRIRKFYVDPNFHRKGIGTKLLARIIKEVRKKQIRTLIVGSSHYAVPFYEALGFRIKGKKWCEVEGMKYYDTLMEYDLI